MEAAGPPFPLGWAWSRGWRGCCGSVGAMEGDTGDAGVGITMWVLQKSLETQGGTKEV